MKPDKKWDKEFRLQKNIEILDILLDLASGLPSMRLTQIMSSLGLVESDFHPNVEPSYMLRKIKSSKFYKEHYGITDDSDTN